MADTTQRLILQVDAAVALAQSNLRALANSVDVDSKQIDGSLRRIDAAQGRLSTSMGSARSAQMELMHVTRAMSDGYAAGTPILQLFSLEIGRVGEAAAMAGGALGKVGEFLGGEWGIVVIAAVSVLSSLAAQFFKTHDAAKSAEKATNEFGNANVAIGRYVDTLTGQLKTQNAVLIQNAILKRQADMDKAHQTIASARTQIVGKIDAANAAHAKVTGEEFVAERQPGRKTYAFDQDLVGITNLVSNGAGIRQIDQALAQLVARRPDLAGLRKEISDIAATAENAFGDKQVKAAEIALLEQRSGATQQYAHALQVSTGEAPSGSGGGRSSRGGGGGGRSRSGRATAGVKPAAPMETAAQTRERLAGEEGYFPDLGTPDFSLPVQQLTDMQSLLDSIGSDIPDLGKMLTTEEQARLQAFSDDFVDSLSSGLADAIVNGRNLGDVLVNTFKRIGAEMLSSGILNLLSGGKQGSSFGSIFANLGNIFGRPGGGAGTPGQTFTPAGGSAINLTAMPHFAAGGSPPLGVPSLVGENGPELFIPRQAGVVIPNHMMRGQNDNRTISVSVTPSRYFDAHVTDGAGRVVAAAAPGLIDAGGQAGESRIVRRASRAIP